MSNRLVIIGVLVASVIAMLACNYFFHSVRSDIRAIVTHYYADGNSSRHQGEDPGKAGLARPLFQSAETEQQRADLAILAIQSLPAKYGWTPFDLDEFSVRMVSILSELRGLARAMDRFSIELKNADANDLAKLHIKSTVNALALTDQSVTYLQGRLLTVSLHKIQEINSYLFTSNLLFSIFITVAFIILFISERRISTESNRKYELLVENSPGVIYQRKARVDFDFLYVSPRVRSLLGFEPDDFGKQFFWERNVHLNDLHRVEKEIHELAAKGGGRVCLEYRFRHHNGAYLWLRDNMLVVEDPEHGLTIEGILLDITAQRNAEGLLRETNERFTLATTGANLGVFDWDACRNNLFWNERMYDIYGLDTHLKGPELFFSSKARIHPEDREKEERFLQKLAGSSERFRFGYRIIRASDQAVRHIEVIGGPIPNDEGIVKRLVGVVIDVTQEYQQREQMQLLIAEKDEMIREIHHRVKNNLQMMSSVLFLKAQSLQDPQMRQLILESRNRLKSMAVIHDRLMNTAVKHSSIDIERLLEGLTSDILQTYSSNDVVKVTFEGSRLMLPNAKAAYCGFIFNEVITNSLRHAFPDRAKGEIHVTVRRVADTCDLAISDNGIGFNLPETGPAGCLGLQLIKDFAIQLKGYAKMNTSPEGTRWTITFPV